MRVVRRVAELRGDQLLELLREDVLEHLGLRVDAIPRHAEGLDQVQLEQAVVAHHLERDPAALLGQRHAAVRAVLDEPELAEPLDHPGRRGGGHAEPFGERVRADRVAVAALERVDRLRVVLNCRRMCAGAPLFKLWYS